MDWPTWAVFSLLHGASSLGTLFASFDTGPWVCVLGFASSGLRPCLLTMGAWPLGGVVGALKLQAMQGRIESIRRQQFFMASNLGDLPLV